MLNDKIQYVFRIGGLSLGRNIGFGGIGECPSFSRSRGNYANPSKVRMALNFMIERGDSLIVGILAADELLAWLILGQVLKFSKLGIYL